MIIYKDPKFNFIEIFNEKNGLLLRSNILNKYGQETEHMPEYRSFPELIDIGIMSKCHVANKYCSKFGVDCYQGIDKECCNMTIDNFEKIIYQCKGKTLQIALGGRGDPNKHENFEEILKITRKNNIIPNLTTTGIDITDNEINLIHEYCGAIAISMYSKIIFCNGKKRESNPLTIGAIERITKANIITNIHYVISIKTIDDAIYRLENNEFPSKINAVIFLLYKPVGLAKKEYMITNSDERIKYFFKLINDKKYNFKIGFDTCFSPLIKYNLKNYSDNTVEFCEASRFSCYISSDMKMYPCSFVQKKDYEIDLNDNSIIEGWCGEEFKKYRNINCSKCQKCKHIQNCTGGCKENLNQYTCSYN